MTTLIAIYFIIFCVAYLLYGKRRTDRINIVMFFAIGCAMALYAGFRDFSWPDTLNYLRIFKNSTHDIFEWSPGDSNHYYKDKGFIFISSAIKSFTTESRTYLFSISLLTFVLLLTDLRKYCLIPLIGLLVYLSRFYLTRDLMQIRASISIVVFLYSLKYVKNRQIWKYIATSTIAFLLHHAIIFAFPLYWLQHIKLNRFHIFLCIVASFVFAVFSTAVITNFVTSFSQYYEIGEAYTSSKSEYTEGLGLANPIIYMQVAILFAFTFFESRLNKLSDYYYILRSGYLLSTMILISLSSFLVLSARGSTALATLEIFIIPLIPLAFKKNIRFLASITVAIAYTAIFYMNIVKVNSL